MRYHFEKPPIYHDIFGETYKCDHPVYNECTLFKFKENGLAVIQQRYDPATKHTWWTSIDPWLINPIYTNPGFKDYMLKRSGPCQDGIYPTVTVRQIMWALRMKPIKAERWNTTFDHKEI